MEVSGQLHASGRFIPGKEFRYPLKRRPVSPWVGLDVLKERKISPAGIQTPHNPARSLVSVLSTPSLYKLHTVIFLVQCGISRIFNNFGAPYPKYLKLQTPWVQLAVTFIEMKYVQSLLFIPTRRTFYVKYIYLSPITSYMFRCLLYHFQGGHCVTCSKTVCCVQCCYTGCATKCKVYPVLFNLHIIFYILQHNLQHCKKHIVLSRVMQWSPWRWCNEHRNM